MKRVCAWCQEEMGEKPSQQLSEDSITHGICRRCANRIFAELGLEMDSFLDRLAAPVVVVDQNGRVATANSRARAFLRKELAEISGHLGGEVFDCAFASLPEGCGQTVHCEGCAVRRTVMDTFQTGRSHLRVPAYINRGRPDDCLAIEVLISTEMQGDVVLLRIDRMGGG